MGLRHVWVNRQNLSVNAYITFSFATLAHSKFMFATFFKGLKALVWGTQTTIHNERIGSLSTRIKTTDPSKSYSWTSGHLLLGEQHPTFFLLEGNYEGPYPSQLTSVYKILDTLSEIREKADRELKKDMLLLEKLWDWKNTFYLASITPEDVDKNEFELSFEPEDPSDTRCVMMIWTNGKLTDIVGA